MSAKNLIGQLLLGLLVLSSVAHADHHEDHHELPSSTSRPRSAKITKALNPSSTTPSTTTVAMATHPHFPGDPTRSPRKPMRATHAPYPYDQYEQRGTHAGFTVRSTYAPYVYGSDPEPMKKKSILRDVLVLDKDIFSAWARDFVTYLAAPFLVPAAITNAFNTPPGLPEHSSLWGKIARGFRAVLLRRSEDRDGSESLPNEENALIRVVNKMKQLKFLQLIKERNSGANSGSHSGANSGSSSGNKEKKERLLSARIVDFLRMKRHRTSGPSPAVVAIVEKVAE